MAASLDVDERRALRCKARNAMLEALTELGGEAKRAAIAERARVLGGFSQRELEAPMSDGAAKTYANPVEHALSWALTSLRRDGLVENPQRGRWRLMNVAAALEESAADRPVSENRLAELRVLKSESGQTSRQGSIAPPGYREPASAVRASIAAPAPAPRRGLSRLWQVLSG